MFHLYLVNVVVIACTVWIIIIYFCLPSCLRVGTNSLEAVSQPESHYMLVILNLDHLPETTRSAGPTLSISDSVGQGWGPRMSISDAAPQATSIWRGL